MSNPTLSVLARLAVTAAMTHSAPTYEGGRLAPEHTPESKRRLVEERRRKKLERQRRRANR